MIVEGRELRIFFGRAMLVEYVHDGRGHALRDQLVHHEGRAIERRIEGDGDAARSQQLVAGSSRPARRPSRARRPSANKRDRRRPWRCRSKLMSPETSKQAVPKFAFMFSSSTDEMSLIVTSKTVLGGLFRRERRIATTADFQQALQAVGLGQSDDGRLVAVPAPVAIRTVSGRLDNAAKRGIRANLRPRDIIGNVEF